MKGVYINAVKGVYINAVKGGLPASCISTSEHGSTMAGICTFP